MELDSKLLEKLPLRKVNSTKSVTLNYDPIGNHIIELREYYVTLEALLEEENELLSKLQPSEKTGNYVIQKPDLPVPTFPENYPFSVSFAPLLENKRKLRCTKFSGELPQCKQLRNIFIENILLQTGFCITETEDDTILIEYLSDILDVFLKKFVSRLEYNKRSVPESNGGRDLMDPLETTLRNFGIGGISALHSFYYKNVVKKHDLLYKECEDLYLKYSEDNEELYELY